MTEDYPLNNQRKTKNDKKAKRKHSPYKKGGHARAQPEKRKTTPVV